MQSDRLRGPGNARCAYAFAIAAHTFSNVHPDLNFDGHTFT
ncbi:hypothetical protein [Promineifilum sp.]